MTDSLSSIANRFADTIGGLNEIGLVHTFSPRDRKDIRDLITSPINGGNVMRAWWVHGPKLPESRWLTGMSPRYAVRSWVWEFHGIEGLTPTPDPNDLRIVGDDLHVLRDKALAVTDALDADELDLGGLAFDAEPCVWRQEPHHTEMGGRAGAAFGVAYVVITKQITTMPSKG